MRNWCIRTTLYLSYSGSIQATLPHSQEKGKKNAPVCTVGHLWYPVLRTYKIRWNNHWTALKWSVDETKHKNWGKRPTDCKGVPVYYPATRQCQTACRRHLKNNPSIIRMGGFASPGLFPRPCTVGYLSFQVNAIFFWTMKVQFIIGFFSSKSTSFYSRNIYLYPGTGLNFYQKKYWSPKIFSDLTFIKYFSFYTPSNFSKSWCLVLKVTSLIRLIKINEG